MRKVTDLYPYDGELLMTEYTEQYPSLLSNVGMASLVRSDVRVTPEDEEGTKAAGMRGDGRGGEGEGAGTAADAFENGRPVVLGKGDASPFIGELDPGDAQQTLCNMLAFTPMHKHKQKHTDFLLLKTVVSVEKNAGQNGAAAGSGNASGADSPAPPGAAASSKLAVGDKETVAYLRELPGVHICGQQEPQVGGVVHAPVGPNSRKGKDEFMKHFISFHILRLFRKNRYACLYLASTPCLYSLLLLLASTPCLCFLPLLLASTPCLSLAISTLICYLLCNQDSPSRRL
jgi:hypothetical protein